MNNKRWHFVFSLGLLLTWKMCWLFLLYNEKKKWWLRITWWQRWCLMRIRESSHRMMTIQFFFFPDTDTVMLSQHIQFTVPLFCSLSHLASSPSRLVMTSNRKIKIQLHFSGFCGFFFLRLVSRRRSKDWNNGKRRICFKLITWLRWICFLAVWSCDHRGNASKQHIHTHTLALAIITGNLFGTQTNKTNRIDFRLDRVSRHEHRTCMNCVRCTMAAWWRRWRCQSLKNAHMSEDLVIYMCEIRQNAKEMRHRSREKWLKTIYRQIHTRTDAPRIRSSNSRDASTKRWTESKSREWLLPSHPHDMYLFRESAHELYFRWNRTST